MLPGRGAGRGAATRSPATSFIPSRSPIFKAAGPNCAPFGTKAARPSAIAFRTSRVRSLCLQSFHADNGSEFLNWQLYEYLTGRQARVPFTRSRAYRKNDNAHVEQKNWTHVRQLLGHDRFEHPQRVPLMNDLYAREWSQFQNHLRPTLKLHSRDKLGSRTAS